MVHVGMVLFYEMTKLEKIEILVGVIDELTMLGRDIYRGEIDVKIEYPFINEGINFICSYIQLLLQSQIIENEGLIFSDVVKIATNFESNQGRVIADRLKILK